VQIEDLKLKLGTGSASANANQIVCASSEEPIAQLYCIPMHCYLAEIKSNPRWSPQLTVPNRIIDCVNACAGMKDPAAEILALREEIKRLRAQ